MNHEQFEQVVDDQIDMCKATLVAKNKEYSTDADKLHNFKVAGALQCMTPEQALGGMLAKHLVSIFDGIRKTTDFKDPTPMAVWDEKIKDAMNYLLLLKGLLVERQMGLITVELNYAGGPSNEQAYSANLDR